MKGATVGYIRVSTQGQNPERQLAGMALDKVFEDTCSGRDTNRPQLAACLAFLREGDFLVVHSSDRLARSLEDLQRLVRDLTNRGVSVRFVKEGLTFTAEEPNPMQTLMFQMVGAFAQFERALIRERQREGIARAKQEGRHLGRARSLSEKDAAILRERAASGESKISLAAAFGISRQSVYRYLRGK
jgi:Site-specific recombinases, DNA invertase Pin homologs